MFCVSTVSLAAIAFAYGVAADPETSIVVPNDLNYLGGPIHGDILGVDSVKGHTTWRLRQGAFTGTWAGQLGFDGTATLVEGSDYLSYTRAALQTDPEFGTFTFYDSGECSLAGNVEDCVFVNSLRSQAFTTTETDTVDPLGVQVAATGTPAPPGSSASASGTAKPGSSSSFPSTTAQSSPSPSNTAPSSPSNTVPSSPSPSALVPPRAPKKKNLAGPIAGGVVGGLVVVFTALAFFLCRARRPNQSTSVTTGGAVRHEDKEKTAVGPSLAADQGDWTPAELFTTLPSGETQLSPPAHAVPSEILAAEEKYALRAARQEEAAQQVSVLEQEIRELTEEAEVRHLPVASTAAIGSTGQSDTNLQLLEELRMLRNQVNTIQQQQQQMSAAMNPGLPAYTPG